MAIRVNFKAQGAQTKVNKRERIATHPKAARTTSSRIFRQKAAERKAMTNEIKERTTISTNQF